VKACSKYVCREKKHCVGVRKESRVMVVTKLLCFRWMSPVFIRVHDNKPTSNMQSAVSDIGKSVLTELQCTACKEYMVPPITLCLGGHNICNTCRPTVPSCPTCKQRFLKTRNVSLENLSLQMKFPCQYIEYGCKDTFPYNAFREHEAICGYSPQTCPVDCMRLKLKCTWTGIADDVKKHLQAAHKELCEDYNAQHLLRLSSSNASSYTQKFLFAYNQIFSYRLQIQSGIIYVALHYIGPAENDLKYQYNVIVINNDDTEGVMMTLLARRFTGTEDDVFSPKNCLILHHALTERFRNENGELAVLLKIVRVDE